jgi:hypothetical protein
MTTQYLELISKLAGVLEALAVVGSLIYVAIQLKRNTKAIKSASYHNITSAMSNIETRISEDVELASIYRVGCEGKPKLGRDEQLRFEALLLSYFNFYENLYYQYKIKVLEDEMWEGWCKYMFDHLKQSGVKEWWGEKSAYYSQGFRDYIEAGQCPTGKDIIDPCRRT